LLNQHPRSALIGLAILASLFGCGQAPSQRVSAQTAASARVVGARLAEQDRQQAKKLRSEIAKIVVLDGVGVREADRSMRVRYTVHNLSSKAISRFDVALEADGTDGARIGTTELHMATPIAARASSSVVKAFPYTQFGDDTGAMREALGKPKRFFLLVKWIKFADGSEAGYDD